VALAWPPAPLSFSGEQLAVMAPQGDDVGAVQMTANDVPAAGRCSGVTSPSNSSRGYPSEATPQRRGALARGYESRFGTSIFEASPVSSPTSQKSRKAAAHTFTDPTNPFARNQSKAMTKVEDVRADNHRAGVRTRNPCMIPQREGPGERQKTIPYQYGHHAWKPGKRCSDSSPSHWQGATSPRSGAGAAEAMVFEPSKPCSALENYLNDMKRCRSSLRAVPGTPSADLKRMNAEVSVLPSDRKSANSEDWRRRSRSLSMDRSTHDESTNVDVYGFARKRPGTGKWTEMSPRNLLHHETNSAEAAPKRSERFVKADQRFEEVVAHMKDATPALQKHFDTFKERNYDSTGLLFNSSPVIS